MVSPKPSAVHCGKTKDIPTCHHRYKGFENLLRRFAFNLGNSPSRTEVKIVSCIPIDVTDLQNKIIKLEKQLEHGRGKRSNSKKSSACPPRPAHPPPPAHSPPPGCLPPPGCQYGKSCPNQTLPVVVNRVGQDFTRFDCNSRQFRLSESPNQLRRSINKTPDLSLYLQDPNEYKVKSLSKDDLQTGTRNVFGRVIPEIDRTRLVYYGQTSGSPFINYKKANDTSKEVCDEAMDRGYLSSLLERQHQVKTYVDDEMLGSQGSAPVCRDTPRCSGTSDDLCSCCRGNFLNMDCKIRKPLLHDACINNGNVYYDSSLYDLQPVREKPGKNSELAKKGAPELDLSYLPEYYRFKPEYCFNLDSIQPNRRGKKTIQKERRAKPVFLPNDSSATDGLVEFSHVYPKRISPKQELRYNSSNRPVNAECYARSDNTEFLSGPRPIYTLSASNHLSKPLSENVECQLTDNSKCPIGQMKALQTSLSRLGSNHNCVNVTLKNAACLVHPVNEIECQTDPLNNAQSNSFQPPDKTESTLNQIKTMLETVLIEVKTNSGVKTAISEKETKDATVQNIAASECERLLNSFTYSPYAMLNPYMPSCSRGLPTYCSSMMHQPRPVPRHEMPPTDFSCVSNFPEMVHQTIAAHSCFPDRSAMQPRQTLTCGTNTLHDPPKRRSTETEDLIKEIYKSIKLDVDYPVKIASRDAIHESKPTDVRQNSPERKLTMGREEMVFRGDVDTARLGSPSSHSSLTRPHRRGSFHQQPAHKTSAQRRQCVSKGTNKDSVGSDTESTANIDIIQPSVLPAETSLNPLKKGFFGKVMSSVVKRMRKKEQLTQNVEKRTTGATRDSESSDFETPRDKPVKHVSYAPAAPHAWREETERPVTASSKTRRLGHVPYRHPPHQASRMPRYVPPRPRSVLRPSPGSSQIRRTLYRPQPPNRPRTPPEYMKRLPHNQYDWRTTPARPATNEFKPRMPPRSPGLKITNKAWMKKPVHHLGFACGPEKERIMMQY